MKQAESLALLSRIYGIQSVDLDDFGAELPLFEQISENFARHHQLVPVLIVPETQEHPRMLVVAMTDPVNSFAVHQLSRQFGLPVQVLAATYEQIVQVIADCYPRLLAGEEPYA